MPTESKYDFIEDLDTSLPNDGDDVSEGSIHLRGTKSATQGSFPNLGQAAVTKTAAELNDIVTKTELQAFYPVGAIWFGIDPTPLIGGTWEQLAEGTFLMNTVSGADLSGGQNSKTLSQAEMPAHTHTQTAHSHTIGAGGGDSTPQTAFVQNAQNQNSGTVTTSGVAPTIQSAGGSAAFDMRPVYVGVAIYRRIA